MTDQAVPPMTEDRQDRWYKKSITITTDHQRLAQRLNIVWSDNIELGSPGLDPKRPFGNSDMPGDVAEILGWQPVEWDGLSDEQRERAYQLHFEMGYVLKAALIKWLEPFMEESYD